MSRIRAVYKTIKRSMFFKNEDTISPDLKSECVYAYNCGHCKSAYIGETSRHLMTRIKEHIKGYPVPTEVTLHPHEPSYENFKIISSSKHHRLLEAIIIIKENEKGPKKLLNRKEASIPLILNL